MTQSKTKAENSTQPHFAYRSLNRCNLPSAILGSCRFQIYPQALYLDGVLELHHAFFQGLENINNAQERALHFQDYMNSAFLLNNTEEAGFNCNSLGPQRDKANYLRLLRGWMFDADSIEGAVMKHWVTSRFGLRTLKHHSPINNLDDPAYLAYQADYVRGLYNSNALESQLDLLYSYCQYELQRQWPQRSHFLLYRATNQIDKTQKLCLKDKILLNNLNSFTDDASVCESFGDHILGIHIPVSKLVYFPELLPGILRGEQEYLVLGGVYQIHQKL